MGKAINILFKGSIFLVLCVLPLLWYYHNGFIKGDRAVWLIVYQFVLGFIPSLVYNLPENIWKK